MGLFQFNANILQQHSNNWKSSYCPQANHFRVKCMSHLLQIMKLTLSKGTLQKDQKEERQDDCSQLSGKRLKKVNEGQDSHEQSGNIENIESDEKNQDLMSSKQHFVMIHKRRLQFEIEQEAGKIWHELVEQQKIQLSKKDNQNLEEQGQNQCLQRHYDKNQNSYEETETKHQAVGGGLIANQEVGQNSFLSSNEPDNQNQNDDPQTNGNNQQNDQTNTSTAAGDYSNSQVAQTIVINVILQPLLTQKSQSNSSQLHNTVNQDKNVLHKESGAEEDIQNKPNEIRQTEKGQKSDQDKCQSGLRQLNE